MKIIHISDLHIRKKKENPKIKEIGLSPRPLLLFKPKEFSKCISKGR